MNSLEIIQNILKNIFFIKFSAGKQPDNKLSVEMGIVLLTNEQNERWTIDLDRSE